MDTSAHLIEREITPILWPGAEIYVSEFANSPNPNYQELSRRFIIAKDWDEYEDMVRKVTSTGSYADIGTIPWCFSLNNCAKELKHWYKSSESIAGKYPYSGHLTNKKWPLKKVK